MLLFLALRLAPGVVGFANSVLFVVVATAALAEKDLRRLECVFRLDFFFNTVLSPLEFILLFVLDNNKELMEEAADMEEASAAAAEETAREEKDVSRTRSSKATKALTDSSETFGRSMEEAVEEAMEDAAASPSPGTPPLVIISDRTRSSRSSSAISRRVEAKAMSLSSSTKRLAIDRNSSFICSVA